MGIPNKGHMLKIDLKSGGRPRVWLHGSLQSLENGNYMGKCIL